MQTILGSPSLPSRRMTRAAQNTTQQITDMRRRGSIHALDRLSAALTSMDHNPDEPDGFSTEISEANFEEELRGCASLDEIRQKAVSLFRSLKQHHELLRVTGSLRRTVFAA